MYLPPHSTSHVHAITITHKKKTGRVEDDPPEDHSSKNRPIGLTTATGGGVGGLKAAMAIAASGGKGEKKGGKGIGKGDIESGGGDDESTAVNTDVLGSGSGSGDGESRSMGDSDSDSDSEVGDANAMAETLRQGSPLVVGNGNRGA